MKCLCVWIGILAVGVNWTICTVPAEELPTPYLLVWAMGGFFAGTFVWLLRLWIKGDFSQPYVSPEDRPFHTSIFAEPQCLDDHLDFLMPGSVPDNPNPAPIPEQKPQKR